MNVAGIVLAAEAAYNEAKLRGAMDDEARDAARDAAKAKAAEQFRRRFLDF